MSFCFFYLFIYFFCVCVCVTFWLDFTFFFSSSSFFFNKFMSPVETCNKFIFLFEIIILPVPYFVQIVYHVTLLFVIVDTLVCHKSLS